MILKTLEIRDAGTHIPALAIKMSHDDPTHNYQLMRVGFMGGSDSQVILMMLNNQEAHSDPYDWNRGARTMPEAHVWIEKHFDELKNGDVVDVDFLYGRTAKPKVSEQFNCQRCFSQSVAFTGSLYCATCMGLEEPNGEPASRPS